MERRKILFLSSWFPSQEEPTNGNFVQRHAEAVACLHQVEVLYAVGRAQQATTYTIQEETTNGVRTVLVYYQKSKYAWLNPLRRFRAYLKGLKHISRPDLIHAHIMQKPMLFAVYLKKRWRVPMLLTEHWSGFLKENQAQLSLFQRWTAQIIAQHAALISPVSHRLKRDLEKLLPQKKMQVVPNVVDTQLFYPSGRNNAQPFIFLHISNLIPLKNTAGIINAAHKLHQDYPNFELHIGGDGDLAPIQQRIEEWDAQHYIKTFGTLSHTEVAERMKNADAFILFSDYENLPCVLIEALSCGLKIIATDVGGVSEIINHPDWGVLVPPRDEDALRQAMQDLLPTPNSLSDKKNKHQNAEARYSQQAIAQQFHQLYQTLLHR